MTTSDNTWLRFESASNEDIQRHQSIRWETVKTEEEEYLDKLQSKLASVMSNGFKNSRPNDDRLGLRHDELHDELVAITSLPPDDEEGLHLLYDQPQTEAANPSLPSTSAATITLVKNHENPEGGAEVQKGLGDVAESPTRRRTVRFRSRVRITSGIHSLSRSSSAGGSAASSISVPLNTGSTASLSELSRPDITSTWLGGVSAVRHERRRTNSSKQYSPVNERTPLVVPVASTYSAAVTIDSSDEELDRIRMAARKTEEQVVFGKWPVRLFNRHWWWWKIEPLVCCCERFDDESDDE